MSRSTFSGFTVAQLGMNASQRALEVTGQNITNINTSGYTRQQVDQVSLNLNGSSLMATSAGSKIGYGVEVTGVSQIRDPFLDVQYRNQIAKVGTADARQATLDQLADIFDETDTEALKTAFNNLESSLDDLSAKANNSEFDSIVRTRCQVLLNYIHQKADDLSSVRQDNLDSLEKTDIPTLNNLLSDIGGLNAAIWTSQVQGNPALELLDQRNSKLDELASYLPISVTYQDVVISAGTKFEYPVVKFTGSDGMTYNLTAGEHGENFASLSMEKKTDANGEENGKVSIVLTPASDFPSYADVSPLKTDITQYLKEGTIKGTVDMLNKSGELDDPPTDYRGIGYYEKSLDALVQSFANTFNELNTNTKPYTGVTSFPTTGLAAKTDDDKAEFTFSFSKASDNVLKNEKVKINGKTYTFGSGTDDVPIGADLNESIQNLVTKLNADTDAQTMNVNGAELAGTWKYDADTKNLTWTSNNDVTGDITKDSIKTKGNEALNITYIANPSNIRNYDLFKTSDGSSIFTASNIKVSDDWMNKKISIIASHDSDDKSTASDNILKMKNALKEERDFKYEYTYVDSNGVSQRGSIRIYSGDFYQCYSNIENTQGIASSANSAILSHNISVLEQTANNRDSVSGVSLDEEGINLLQYQRSYTAAARLMTTLDEALDVLINNTGVVGR